MPVELMDSPAGACDTLLVGIAGRASRSEEEEYAIVAGSGACRACAREGKNPQTGGRPCGGYISTGYSPYACKNCGHSYDQHA